MKIDIFYGAILGGVLTLLTSFLTVCYQNHRSNDKNRIKTGIMLNIYVKTLIQIQSSNPKTVHRDSFEPMLNDVALSLGKDKELEKFYLEYKSLLQIWYANDENSPIDISTQLGTLKGKIATYNRENKPYWEKFWDKFWQNSLVKAICNEINISVQK